MDTNMIVDSTPHRKDKNMRTDKLTISLKTIIKCISGTIYEMAPFNLPSKMDTIMKSVVHKLENICVDKYSHRYLYTTWFDFAQWIETNLMSCKEFRELNLSYNEVLQGIDVDDESRGGNRFTSMYDIDTEESMRDDFIDLDACISNILRAISHELEVTDCFLCDNIDTEKCMTCTLNKQYNNRYFHTPKPYDIDAHDRWCTYSCKYNYIICCADCVDNRTCTDRCNEDCDTCTLCKNKSCIEER